MIRIILWFKESSINKLYSNIVIFLEKYLMHLVVFIMRLWIARIFWFSGVSKISNWSSTLYLFEYEHKVPLLPTGFAAFIATLIELVAPPLLLIGILNRLLTIPLLIMVAVMQFTYLDSIHHLYWTLLLCTILCYGSGKLSLDYIIRYKICNTSK